ncbi:WD40-repeat-containing domain protein [Globomyces pollinis-pini]|nr:WD40-repeat-containing domain protein [Globomyces pollinis-pini]
MERPFQLVSRISKIEGDYALDVTTPSVQNASIIGLPMASGTIHLHDISTLQQMGTLPSLYPETIISQCLFDSENPSLLWSSNKNGSVILYDIRTSNAVHQFESNNPIISFDTNSNHHLLAAGTELAPGQENPFIFFWDIRSSMNPLNKFEECHSDDITQIKFHPNNPNLMISGSTDTLVNLYNLETFEEDDALYQVIKGDSVNQVGFFGPNFEYIYYLTHLETVSLWKFEEAEKICSFGDVRASTSEATLDYCIGCSYNTAAQRLFLTAGSREGSLSIFDVGLNGLELAYTLNGGHGDIIRGVYWDIQNGILISAAEDGSVSTWSQ